MRGFEVKPEVLKQVIERAGGVERLRSKFKTIEKWLSGEKFPTLKQLEELSKLSGIPFGDIILGKVPYPFQGLNIVFFRRDTGRAPSVELEKLVELTQSRVNFASEYLEELGYEPLDFVGSIGINDSVEEVADYIKKAIKLERDWFKKVKTKKEAFGFLREKLENAGIFVFLNNHFENNTRLRLNPDEFKGFAIADKFAPAIFVNTNAFLSTQIFTLIHELVHLFLGKSAISDIDETTLEVANAREEKFCNRVAAALLIPQEELENKSLTYETLENIGERLKVSTLVVLLRAFETGRIRKREYFEYLQIYKRQLHEFLRSLQGEEKNRLSKGGGDWYRSKVNQLSRKFIELAIEAFYTRELPPNHFAFLTGVKVSNIPKLEERHL